MKDLSEIRNELDITDAQITELLEKRIKLSRDVAEYKINTGKKVLDREREEQKLKKICSLVESMDNKYIIEELFTGIIDMSRKIQYAMITNEQGEDVDFREVDFIENSNKTVVYQGVEGAYSHEAMLQIFGEKCNNFAVKTFAQVVIDVKKGKADYGVLPIENSSAGIVSEIYDLLANHDVYIVKEINLKISHVLMGVPGTKIEDIKKVYSHQQGLLQCKDFLDEHRLIEQIPYANTAASALKVSKDLKRENAAIASPVAAKLYGLEIIKDDITGSELNTTKFAVISKEKIYESNSERIMVSFELPHESGSLYTILSHFIYNKLNMTQIESRPIPDKKWEYRFFVEFEGSLDDIDVLTAIKGIREEAKELKIIGNY